MGEGGLGRADGLEKCSGAMVVEGRRAGRWRDAWKNPRLKLWRVRFRAGTLLGKDGDQNVAMGAGRGGES